MSLDTVRVVAGRVAEHALAHGLTRVSVVLHGGEPLLLGRDGLQVTVAQLRRGIEPAVRLDLRMQSNGVLLSEAICELLVEYDVRVGISLDGDRLANDRHRRFASGASSHDRVLEALALLRRPEYRRQYAGILCTIDVGNDPISVYEALVAQAPPRVDLLLPHATWEHPPVRPDGVPAPYAQWLLRIYDRWMADGRPMSIRLFDSLRSAGAGGPSSSEWVGLDPADLVVVETDGAWEQVDSLKIAFDGAPATGLSVFTHSVDQVAMLPEIIRRQGGLDDLAPVCRVCPVVGQCGGGLFAHRYRPGSGFDNPSVYCADLMELIVSINSRPSPPTASGPAEDGHELPAALLEQVGSGCVDPAAVQYLAEAQLSIGRALVVAVAERGSPMARTALEILGRLDRDAPQAVRAVLGHPYLRVWAVEALRRADLGGEDASGYLGCVAAAAAVRAGEPVVVCVPISSGVVHLPTVGTVTVPGFATGTAELSVSAESVTVRCGSEQVVVEVGSRDRPDDGDRHWQPARWVTADGLTVLLEDLDPYRDCHDWKADSRLAPDRAGGWRRAITAAWRVVQEDAAGQAPAMRLGLRAVTPLSGDPGGLLRSSTARHAFGSVGAAMAADEALAVMLVHELQHTLLGALLDLCDLFDPGYRRHLAVAWRSDPRPIEGVLQGTFAHLAVADIWRTRAERADAGGIAISTYRQYHDWTAAAIDVMVASGALTSAGSRFVASMAATMASWAG